MDIRTLELGTPRLRLRPTRIEDFDAWAAFMADTDAARFIGGQQTREAAWRGFAMMAGAWQLQGFAMFSVIEKATGRWLGRVGPWQPEGWPGTEIGWGIVRDCWGKGYATEAAIATIDWAFAELDWHDVIHVIDVDNVPSQRVAARLGSVNRGPGRLPAPFDVYRVDIWGQTRAQGEQNRNRCRASISAKSTPGTDF
jgi:RimJ/RimL family protein N-acetyltransferase